MNRVKILQDSLILRAFMSSADRAWCIADMNSVIRQANPPLAEILNAPSLSDVIGTKISDYVPQSAAHPHRNDATWWANEAASGAMSYPESGEVQCVDFNGEPLTLMIGHRRIFRAPDAQGDGVICCMGCTVTKVSAGS